jgi:hypothetical protein
MHAYVNRHPVEVTPRFRRTGRGRAVANASLSVPLRTEDLVAILYYSQLDTAGLADVDAVRTAIADALVNKGAHRIAAEKTRLQNAVQDKGDYDSQRLELVESRVRAVFPPRRRLGEVA